MRRARVTATGSAKSVPSLPPSAVTGSARRGAGDGAPVSAAHIGRRPGPLRSLWHRVSSLVPYGPSLRMQVAWLRLRRWFQSRDVLEVMDLLRAVLPRDTDSRRLADTALGCLLCVRFIGWRMRALARSPRARLDRVVRFHGLEVLHGLRETGRGFMIVNSKFGAGEAVPLLFARFGYPLWSLEGTSHLDMAGLPGIVGVLELARVEPLGLRELRAARKLLEEGCVLHLAGDGNIGTSGVVLPFLGRARRFPEGFAYLSARTGSPVVPVFSTMAPSGRIDVEILPPLPSGPDDARLGERVLLMLKAYAQLLERKWTAHPSNLLPTELRKYVKLPVLDGVSAP